MPTEMKDRGMLSGAWTAVAIILIVFLGVQSYKVVKETAEVGHEPVGRDTFVVAGTGKVSGKPTLAEVNLGLYSEGKDVPKTQQDNTTKVNAIIAAMKALGIAEADLQTSGYSISPRFDYTDGKQTIIGYAVSQNLAVKVRDLSQVGTVLAKAGELGSNQVNGVSFTIDDPTMIQTDARKKAIADAQKKAQELADTLGVTLVRVVSFSENVPSTPVPMMYRDMVSAVPSPANVAPDIQTGELDVTSNVSVTYEIR